MTKKSGIPFFNDLFLIETSPLQEEHMQNMLGVCVRFAGKAFQAAPLLTIMLVIAGCAGMMAENKFIEEATQKYVFNLPGDKLFEEVVKFIRNRVVTGGAGARTGTSQEVSVGSRSTAGFGKSLSIGAQEMSTDEANLTVTGPWVRDHAGQERLLGRVTRVDDSHSTLNLVTERQNRDEKTRELGMPYSSRATNTELAVIRKLDPKAAEEIMAGAKKAAEETKKK